MNIPNAISLGRLLSVPLFVWLILTNETQAAFWVFLVAALSDAIDGIVAKQFDMQTNLGAFLDPIADKTLLVSAFVVLGAQETLPLWIVIPVVSRDVLIVGGALVFDKLTGELNMEPLFISKLNTLTQILLVLAALLADIDVFAFPPAAVVTSLSIATLITTLVSGAAYVYIWIRRAHLFERTSGEEAKKEIP